MKVYFFDRWSGAIAPLPTGHNLPHIPLPEEVICIHGSAYICNSRSFHINRHGEHEVYLTLRGTEEAAF